ncbi:Ger(x)C family spore germination protein [Paenibacillus qinlingensis]|uniref:Ger(X)C family germination protein n=1 Tax=Paenibacillus qinlingensis TaxID=1837343 RepID=A0ABU1NRZ3_9BACL|nr:Ger(x)C family spore germination protein [Paenibacillus qinlingensis]MDR6550214.1 Ger(x)C family germination protein [Paenibacillus qinlingensis]
MGKLFEQIKKELFHTDDLKIRVFEIEGKEAKLMYLETLCDVKKMEKNVFKQWFQTNSSAYENMNIAQLLTTTNVESIYEIHDAIKVLMNGNGLIGIADSDVLYAFNGFRISFVIILCLCLCGCWDQRELKNIRMVHTAGIDLLENDFIRLTVSIPTVKSSVESQGKVVTPKVSGEGHSVQEASMNLQRIVSQHMDLRETRILLVNSQLAEKNLYEGLDFFYREAHFPINVYIAVTDPSAQKIVQLDIEDRSLISEYLYDLLISGEEEGLIPKESPYLITQIMFAEGIDNVLPYLSQSTMRNRAKIDGVALFHNSSMTGRLDETHARAYVLLTNKRVYGAVTEQVGPNQSFTTFTYGTKNHSIQLNTNGPIQADVYVKMNCELIDNPSGVRLKKADLVLMERELEEILTKRADESLRKLQEANCDGLGIGLRSKGLHPKLWKTLDWNKEFAKIDLHAHVKVRIENHGLLN